KKRHFLHATKILTTSPYIAPLLALPIGVRLNRLKRRVFSTWTAPQNLPQKSICLISRQRLCAATSGSSNYVLSLANALHQNGYEIHLVQPSPSVFGRLPVLVKRREAAIFKSIKIRRSLHIGPCFFALDPRILFALARGVFVRGAGK